jgi:hypothetical protein
MAKYWCQGQLAKSPLGVLTNSTTPEHNSSGGVEGDEFMTLGLKDHYSEARRGGHTYNPSTWEAEPGSTNSRPAWATLSKKEKKFNFSETNDIFRHRILLCATLVSWGSDMEQCYTCLRWLCFPAA